MPNSGDHLIPNEIKDFLLVHDYDIELSELPPMPGPEAGAIDARIAQRNPLWRRLYHNMQFSDLAAFIVYRFPRVPSVARTYRERIITELNQLGIYRCALHKLIEAKAAIINEPRR